MPAIQAMIAITWNAFSHSYITQSSTRLFEHDLSRQASCSAHTGEHLLNMGNRGLRHDAMPEVEDEWPGRKRLEYSVDRPVERDTAGDQHQWIEVTLHRQAGLELVSGE